MSKPAIEGNVRQVILDLQKRVAELERRDSTVNQLSELAPDMGLVQAGEFRSGNGVEPGDGFSGVRMNAAGVSGYSNDVLQAQMSATDGTIRASGEDIVLNGSGININAIRDALNFFVGSTKLGDLHSDIDASGNYLLQLLFSMQGSNLVSDSVLTPAIVGWAEDTEEYHIYPRSYKVDYTSTLSSYASGFISISDETSYRISFWHKFDYLDTGSPYFVVYLDYYDSGDSLLSSGELYNQITPFVDFDWRKITTVITTPINTAKVKFRIDGVHPNTGFATLWFDGFSILEILSSASSSVTLSGNTITLDGALTVTGNSTFSKLLLGNVGALTGGSVTLADNEATSFTPTTARGVLILRGAGAQPTEYAMITYAAIAGTAYAYSWVNGTNTEITTGALAGTTGTDVKLTISAHTDGKIYIENRRGGSRSFAWQIVAGV